MLCYIFTEINDECGSWSWILVLLCGCVMPCLPSDHLMHVRKCLLDIACAIAVLNVFAVLLCLDLTTAESMVKVWRR